MNLYNNQLISQNLHYKNKNKMINNHLQDTRKRLGKEFNTVPDESLEMLIFSLTLIARMMIESTPKESR